MLADWRMRMQPELHHFKPSSGVPNSDLPLVFWRNRVPAGVEGGEAVCALYRRNSWARRLDL
jgi:hypothetical protein